MPKETFNNLPVEKRELIEKCALKEFADYGYDAASINRIVLAAGIAKGSFYQYFKNKKDLFFMLIDSSAKRKMAFISPVLIESNNHDFFVVLRELFLSGIRFAAANPEGAKLAEWLMKNSHHEIYSAMIERASPQAGDFYSMMIDKAIQKGEIRSDMDVGFLSSMLTSLTTTILNYYFNHVANSYLEDEDKLMSYVDKMIDLIKFGLKPKEVKSND